YGLTRERVFLGQLRRGVAAARVRQRKVFAELVRAVDQAVYPRQTIRHLVLPKILHVLERFPLRLLLTHLLLLGHLPLSEKIAERLRATFCPPCLCAGRAIRARPI